MRLPLLLLAGARGVATFGLQVVAEGDLQPAPPTTINALDVASMLGLPGWLHAADEAAAHGDKWAADADLTTPCAVVVAFINGSACTGGSAPQCRQVQRETAEALSYAGDTMSAQIRPTVDNVAASAVFGLIDVAEGAGGRVTDGRAFAAALRGGDTELRLLGDVGMVRSPGSAELWLFTMDRRYSNGAHRTAYADYDAGNCSAADRDAEEAAEKEAVEEGWPTAADSAGEQLFSRLLMHGAPFSMPAPFTGSALRDAVHQLCGGEPSAELRETWALQNGLGRHPKASPAFTAEDAAALMAKGADLNPWDPTGRRVSLDMDDIMRGKHRQLARRFEFGLEPKAEHLHLAIVKTHNARIRQFMTASSASGNFGLNGLRAACVVGQNSGNPETIRAVLAALATADMLSIICCDPLCFPIETPDRRGVQQ